MNFPSVIPLTTSPTPSTSTGTPTSQRPQTPYKAMNVYKAVREYITKVINEAPGMKVMLLDKETTGIVSMVYTQSEILQKEVYLVDRLESRNRELMMHLRAVVYVRPTHENVELLIQELKDPKYGSYYLFFTNVLSAMNLERLADADEHEVVKEVQELFGDYLAINPDLASLNIPRILGNNANQWDEHVYQRTVQGASALLLSLRKKPVIRYQAKSHMCKRLASDIEAGMKQESSLYDFRRPDVSPLLLILDRKDDPVTPLLNQWTYQAMVHELLGIHNQRVDLSKVPNIDKDMKEVVLSPANDDFYRDNMFMNFGDIGMAIKQLVDKFQDTKKTSAKIDTIADMRNFIDNYPQFRQMSGTVHKHAALVGELYRLNNAHDLLDVSEAEQALACQGDHASSLERVRALIDNDKVTDIDRCRLVCLYALRYEGTPNNALPELIRMLKHRHYPEKYMTAIDSILKYGGNKARSSDLFGNKSFLGFTKKALKGLKGVENVYTQHEPLLVETIDLLVKGKLKEDYFPFLSAPMRERPQDIIVFMVGGATYEEARFVSKLNDTLPGVRIVLGGTHVHNCESFLQDVIATGEARRLSRN
eukprot:comp18029_c0_seq1/m.18538 comp18029_c0_seq1/g.18538  ORF comp18029_c0_seq1/g.18538 comp18029_c0_seq1/m.18538 type:complete len:592 (-) comp18029_c0_seq1:128-1903(-)